MATKITQYELSISCPGDIKQEVEIAKEVINEFNSNFSKTLGISIQVRNWRTDSYPESGSHPQKILNKQFIDDSDAIVAMFWTRFGTPTDEYDSGTEEEIERMLESGKQVFLYFSDAPASPSEIDSEQYQKIQQFKEKYKNKGLYWEYKTPEEFKELLYAHLTKYFLNLSKVEEINNAKKPDIKVELVATEEMSPEESYKFKYPMGTVCYKELSVDDIFDDIADMVTVEDIKAYNEALPHKDEIDEYNEQQRLYENAQNNCYDFKLTIDNIGSAKANDIFVDLYFPEGILVYKTESAKNIKEPKVRPEMPEDPIWKAIEEKDKKKNKAILENNSAFILANQFLRDFHIPDAYAFHTPISVAAYNFAIPKNVDYYIEDNKELSVNIDNLLHTRKYTSDEFSLIFTSHGDFEIKYSVMCEEWENPVEGEFHIKVEY